MALNRRPPFTRTRIHLSTSGANTGRKLKTLVDIDLREVEAQPVERSVAHRHDADRRDRVGFTRVSPLLKRLAREERVWRSSEALHRDLPPTVLDAQLVDGNARDVGQLGGLEQVNAAGGRRALQDVDCVSPLRGSEIAEEIGRASCRERV